MTLNQKRGTFNDDEFLELIKKCLTLVSFDISLVEGLSPGNKFYNKVCLDLKEGSNNKLWILHLIDATMRFCFPSFSQTKIQSEQGSRDTQGYY